ncbi:MAG: hypothetical protein EZS28_027780, partial [Streblomastix strix]
VEDPCLIEFAVAFYTPSVQTSLSRRVLMYLWSARFQFSVQNKCMKFVGLCQKFWNQRTFSKNQVFNTDYQQVCEPYLTWSPRCYHDGVWFKLFPSDHCFSNLRNWWVDPKEFKLPGSRKRFQPFRSFLFLTYCHESIHEFIYFVASKSSVGVTYHAQKRALSIYFFTELSIYGRNQLKVSISSIEIPGIC